MMAIPMEKNSKGLVLSLKKKKRKLWSAVHFPMKHETFQAVVRQQRPQTKKRAHAN